MKKTLFFVLFAALILTSCQKKQVYKATLLELMTKGCPACEKIRPDILALETEYKGLVKFQIVDVNTEEGGRITGIYGLKHTPTVIFLDENGIEYFRLENTVQKDVIAAILNTKTGPPPVRPGQGR
jgi:thiol-disulfide isomerase/thioredoxin